MVVILAGEMNFIEDESRGTAASKTTPTWPVLTVEAAQARAGVASTRNSGQVAVVLSGAVMEVSP